MRCSCGSRIGRNQSRRSRRSSGCGTSGRVVGMVRRPCRRWVMRAGAGKGRVGRLLRPAWRPLLLRRRSARAGPLRATLRRMGGRRRPLVRIMGPRLRIRHPHRLVCPAPSRRPIRVRRQKPSRKAPPLRLRARSQRLLHRMRLNRLRNRSKNRSNPKRRPETSNASKKRPLHELTHATQPVRDPQRPTTKPVRDQRIWPRTSARKVQPVPATRTHPRLPAPPLQPHRIPLCRLRHQAAHPCRPAPNAATLRPDRATAACLSTPVARSLR